MKGGARTKYICNEVVHTAVSFLFFFFFSFIYIRNNGLFQTFIGCDYCTQSNALSFEKSFLLEMVNAPMTLMSRTGPE